jgi:hypothetical protein
MRSGRIGAGLALLVSALAAALLVGCVAAGGSADPTAPSGVTGTPAPAPSGTLDAAAARTAVDRLPVSPGGNLAGYERSCSDNAACVFGPAWTDVDHNGCSTRDDVLRRDLREVEIRPGTGGCVVTGGRLVDPYTGLVVDFEKKQASDVSIDHVVSLADAWRSGAKAWQAGRRLQFANDPGNLLATEVRVNSDKSDHTPADWQPALPAARCPYVRIVVTVKARYGLSVRAAERVALARVLATC